MIKNSFKSFARLFVRTRNAREAALGVGIPTEEALVKGEQLLENKNVKAQIRKLDKENEQTLSYVKSGLSRLAFGSVNDAVRLVFDEDITEEKIMMSDLFNVSEIKKVKGGGVEIKFFDRQKALEKLVEFDPKLKEISDAEKFLNAVYSGAKDIPQTGEDTDA